MRLLLSAAAGWALLCTGCDAAQPLTDQVARKAILDSYHSYACAQYFMVGPPRIMDKMTNAPGLGGGVTNDVIVDAVLPIAKTDAYMRSIGSATILNMALQGCSNDFFPPGARFGNLVTTFENVPVGTFVNFRGHYRFQKWESGWKLLGPAD